ncbi:MAG: AAA family ATPase [Clostridia bacterium]|nr:AAA family ATPase [Clostridia bacterium]
MYQTNYEMNNNCFDNLISCFPQQGETTIRWDELWASPLGKVFEQMRQTPQNPVYHAEGDVFSHTKFVCEQLIKLQEYKACNKMEQQVLFLSALLHDTGKPQCTRVEDGQITSPRHAIVGANIVRQLLWTTFDLAGTEEKRNIREAVCLLIKYHSFPPFALKESTHPKKMLAIASNGELTPYFSMKLLYILEKADALGRKGRDVSDYLERIECFKLLAEEAGVWENPHNFSTDFSKRAYFVGKTTWQNDTLYDDSWGTVTLLCGLPASGKDTFVEQHLQGLPVVCLDDIRAQLGIAPTKPQGPVIAQAKQIAKEYLRNKTPFVWNATNVTKDTRNKLVGLFEGYGANVKIVFLETDWQGGLQRNLNRDRSVPQDAIEHMLSKLEIPERHEAQQVCWIIS